MADLVRVAVDSGFILQRRHQTLLGILLLNEIFACIAFHRARHEYLEAGVERGKFHRIFWTQHLQLDTEPRANIGPRRGGLYHHLVAFGTLQNQRAAGKVLSWAPSIIDLAPHLPLELANVVGLRPFEIRNRSVGALHLQHIARLVGAGQHVSRNLHRMAHHIGEHATSLLFALPEPWHVGARVLLRGARKIGPPGERHGAAPDDLLAALHGGREHLVLKVAGRDLGIIGEPYHLFRLG